MSDGIEWLRPAIEAASEEIRDGAAHEDSAAEQKTAFAVWAIQVVENSVGRDEAFEATSIGSPPDTHRGIDGWFVSESGDELLVLQAKYSDAPTETRLTPEDVREFQSAYNRIAYSTGDLPSSWERDLQAAVQQVRENQGQIRIVLAAWMTSPPETEQRTIDASRLFADDEILEVWDAYRLSAEWAKIASDEDLSDQEPFDFEATSEWLDMPLPIPPGVTTAGVISLDAFSLANALRPWATRAIAPNVRFHLGHRGPVNRHILQTLGTDPDKFWLLNNGLTIIADEITRDSSVIHVRNPQIVNGGQTLFSLIGALEGERPLKLASANVMARFIVLDSSPSPQGGEGLGSQLQREIAESTNRQNQITSADLRSNDDVQQELAVAFSRTSPKWFYERKRNSRAALSSPAKKEYAGIITKDELGQRWRAFDGDPAMAIKAKSRMYSDDEPGSKLYEKSFDSSRDPYLYILAYLLFETYRQRRGQLPRYASELARSQNLWAAHCSALTHVALKEHGPIDARRLSNLALDGTLESVYSAIEALGISWLRGRFQAAKRDEQNLQLKSVMEDTGTFLEWMDYLADENEGIRDAIRQTLNG